MVLSELLVKAKKIVVDRQEACAACGLSSDFFEGVVEGVAEMVSILSDESIAVADVLEELSSD